MQGVRDSKLQSVTMDIRQMAAKLCQDDGKIDKQDVSAMLVRASDHGPVTKKDAQDLVWVRETYASKFTKAALVVMDSVVGTFVEEEMKRLKEKERTSKIEKHLVAIEERIAFNLKDRKMREMKVDDKQRVMLNELFGKASRK